MAWFGSKLGFLAIRSIGLMTLTAHGVMCRQKQGPFYLGDALEMCTETVSTFFLL